MSGQSERRRWQERREGYFMPWKTISIELADTWVEALEAYAKDNELQGVEDATRTAIIVYLQSRGYLK
jgi:hypothetical protein